MKFGILAAVVALAFAGSALAQNVSREGLGPAPQMGPQLYPSPTQRQKIELIALLAETRQVCEPSAKVLCDGKTGSAVGRCMTYHTLKLPKPCREMLTKVKLAQEGR
jgi:hypothetical protein